MNCKMTFSEYEFKISKKVINHHHRLKIDLKIAFSEFTQSFSEVELKLSKRLNISQRDYFFRNNTIIFRSLVQIIKKGSILPREVQNRPMN